MSAIEYDPVTKPNEPITGVTVNAAQVYSEWQSSLCGCFGHCTVLCQTCLCYHCTLSNVYTKLETGVPSCSCGTCCANCCADGITAGQASFCGIVGTRRAIISRYNIAGESMCRTLCCAALCTCCSFCQTQREMIIRSDGCGGCCAQGDLVQNERAPDAAPPMGGDSTHDIRYIAPLRPAQRWQSGICGCASCMDCLDCYLCLPCMLGYVGAKVDNLHNIGEPNQEPKMDCCSCLGACLCAYAFIYMNRRELIQRYNIQGESHCDTCCQVYWCTACSAGQQRREMAYRGEWTGGCCLKEAPVLSAANGRVPLATQSPQKQ